MTTTLSNRRRRLLVFVLKHDEYCKAAGSCSCIESQLRENHLIPGSLSMPALASVEAPDAILSVLEVKLAIRRGDVAVLKDVASSPSGSTSESPPLTLAAEPTLHSEPTHTTEAHRRPTKKRTENEQ
jgi:hypothetical protein